MQLKKMEAGFKYILENSLLGLREKSFQILVVKNDWPAGAARKALIKGKLFCSDLQL